MDLHVQVANIIAMRVRENTKRNVRLYLDGHACKFSLLTSVIEPSFHLLFKDGRDLLRILLQFFTSETEPLSSAALKFIFRWFNQERDLLHDLEQVRTRSIELSCS